MKVLVTGGAGFIGSHLVHALLRAGHSVRVIDNLATGKRERLAEVFAEIEWVQADIRDENACAEAVSGVETVLHEAAIPSVARSVTDPAASHDVNVTGSVTLLLACRGAGVKRLVFASSSAIYGPGPDLPKVESMCPAPLSPYAVNKLAVEHYCRSFAALGWLETVCLRYFNVFGPGQDPRAEYAAVVPKFARALLDGRSITVFGDGSQTRDFTFVDNVVQANLKALTAEVEPGEAFNVGCGTGFSINDLVSELGRAVGTDASVQFSAPRPGDVLHSFAAIQRARERLAYQPSVLFADGIARIVAAMRAAH